MTATRRNPSSQSARDERQQQPLLPRLCRSDWYKDVIIYQLHVKAFQDSNGDGVGDFRGLIQRLDYIERLGVTAIWLLPFYPSPLRDDGYDISEYQSINPVYGSMRDFTRFVREAHRRGISVITELVINHTSDQHPWFQRARRARRGSAARNFYVWSDSDKHYSDTRIIFLDTEKSNWTWDSVAGQFFFFFFYSHQPDLNFDNPRVLDEMIKVMNFWLEKGVDGLRLDAIPYLKEREGTNNENLPETHEVLKNIRSALDEKFPDRMLLAEANQWPEDTAPYFGDGDECHMAFHFPLMPRIYMALAQEDRHPITDIMRQTPDIPESCQWAIFLRNHDELTLEMVTDRERDYLWETYATDKQARINLGIRRRLAPLMQNDRRKIELMNALLLSMPGTPVIYYGDELGMGDNIYLGDRDGVRTPMQWSDDRNGGFSRADPQMLYLPPIMDSRHGFQAINVEAQEADPSSLLNWMRRMIAVRRQHSAFGRGSFRILYPRNRHVLAYLRSHGGETILCVANLARSAQAVELDLSDFSGCVPVELVSRSSFPPIGHLTYLLTLSSYGTFWFLLASEDQSPDWHIPTPERLPEFVTLSLSSGRISNAFQGRQLQQLEEEVLPQFLPRQRWFGAKGDERVSTWIRPLAPLDEKTSTLAVVGVETSNAGTQHYFLPLSVLWGEEHVQFDSPKLPYTLARVRRSSTVGALIDGAYDEHLALQLMKRMRAGDEVAVEDGVLRFHGNPALSEMDVPQTGRPLKIEQSNVSVALGDSVLLKIYRRLRTGVQPEIEVSRFLTEEVGFANTPAFLGSLELVGTNGRLTALASAFAFVQNQGDAWAAFANALERQIEGAFLKKQAVSHEAREYEEAEPALPYPLTLAATIGQRTGEMHAALMHESDNAAFRPEPVAAADVEEWLKDTKAQAEAALTGLERLRDSLPPAPAELIDALLSRRSELNAVFARLEGLEPVGFKSRIHGDFHLGQVLVAENDVYIIDFEGEPLREIEERRAKTASLRDVAGMLRSFDYAVWSAIRQVDGRLPPDSWDRDAVAQPWSKRLKTLFLDAYWAAVRDLPNQPDKAAREQLLRLFLMQKAFYEINYELSSRPDWVSIPVHGVLDLLDGGDHDFTR